MSQGVENGATTVPAAGSQPVQLASGRTTMGVLIYALSTNSAAVYVGGEAVTTSTGVPIAAGAYLGLDTGDAGAVYLAGTENDAVRWISTGRTLPA